MSMTARVVGIVRGDEEWEAMRAIWNLCTTHDVDPPDKVYEYFDGDGPDHEGMEVDITSVDYSPESAMGLEIKTVDIPEGVELIRFTISW